MFLRNDIMYSQSFGQHLFMWEYGILHSFCVITELYCYNTDCSNVYIIKYTERFNGYCS